MTNSNNMQRRQLLQSAAALSLLGLAGCATTSMPSKAKVVIVGGGFGGATAAKYIRMLSQYKIDVVLIEPNASFISCPVSNMVLGGHKQMADITSSYEHLSKKHGVTMVQDMVSNIDAAKKTVTLARGGSIAYDKLKAWLQPMPVVKSYRLGKRALKQRLCASSLKPCLTAAPTLLPFPLRHTAAHQARMSVPARLRLTSKWPSQKARF
jgi:hypothetical protein